MAPQYIKKQRGYPMRWSEIINASDFDPRLKKVFLNSVVGQVKLDDKNKVYIAWITAPVKDRTALHNLYSAMYEDWTVIVKVYLSSDKQTKEE